MPRAIKDPSVRQRTNRASTRATLYAIPPEEIEIPELPKRFDEDGNERVWSLIVQEWWEWLWSSPMSSEFGKCDTYGLYKLALLWELFWQGKTYLHSEIRLYEAQFGLNPLARRRLEWEIVNTQKAQEQAEDRSKARQALASRPDGDSPVSGVDPLSA